MLTPLVLYNIVCVQLRGVAAVELLLSVLCWFVLCVLLACFITIAFIGNNVNVYVCKPSTHSHV